MDPVPGGVRLPVATRTWIFRNYCSADKTVCARRFLVAAAVETPVAAVAAVE